MNRLWIYINRNILPAALAGMLADISQMEFSASMIATRHGNTDYMAVL